MRIKIGLTVSALLVAALGSMAPARAADLTYVSGPAGPFVGYTLPFMVMSPGDTITYVNLDGFPHDVVARQTYPGGPSEWPAWCAEAGFDGTPGPGGLVPRCPLFWTPLIGAAQTTPVLGLEALVPGESYEFFCSIHANMIATLVVLP